MGHASCGDPPANRPLRRRRLCSSGSRKRNCGSASFPRFRTSSAMSSREAYSLTCPVQARWSGKLSGSKLEGSGSSKVKVRLIPCRSATRTEVSRESTRAVSVGNRRTALPTPPHSRRPPRPAAIHHQRPPCVFRRRSIAFVARRTRSLNRTSSSRDALLPGGLDAISC